jgi:hypothetical protein
VSLDGGQAKGPQEMTLTIDSKLIGGSCDAKKMQAKQPG